MADFQFTPSPLPQDDRRRYQRVAVNLLGRFMLPNRQEYPCQVVDMSPGGARVVATVAGAPGERVILYVDHIGRLEGVISGIHNDGFGIYIEASPRKQDKIAAQLTWITNQDALGMIDDRRHVRHIPRNPNIMLTTESGLTKEVKALDISLSGAAFESSYCPPIGSLVRIGQVRGYVVRATDHGFAVEFTNSQAYDDVIDLGKSLGTGLS
jgi:hypothetical protein